MLRVVLVLFVHVSVVRCGGGSRYGDYSAAGMPHYNMEYESRIAAPMDEYPDRSPDAPAHLDYKYEEETRDTVKSFPVKHIDDDVFQKQNAKGRRAMKVTDIEENEVEARDDDVVPKHKSSRRFTKHRTRIKGDRIIRPSGRRMNYDRSRNAAVDLDERNDFDLSKVRSHKYNRDSDFELRDTTPKAPRRKPRDRTIRPEKEIRYENDNDEETNKIREMDDQSEDIDTRNDNRHLKNQERTRPVLSIIDQVKPKTYQEYDEYQDFDMKRVNRLKNKLPDLFRRTKASDPEPTRTRATQELPYRRVNRPKSTTKGSTKSSISSIKVITYGPVTNQSAVTSKSLPTSAPKNRSALSIAEKSRLSILKKAQRKERERNTTTTKPPVLLQVTQKMQTVVMVEPNPSNPQFRARNIFDDSPERIERAKKLMRHKLLSGAKSIHELADNWDDTISTEATTSKVVSVAERELKAVLGHRQRKDIQATLPTNFLPTTFPPHAVDPLMDDQWNSFIVSNNTRRLQHPLYITIVVLINYLQYYRSTFYSTSIEYISKLKLSFALKNFNAVTYNEFSINEFRMNENE